jgi:hypothetical protein
MEWETCLKFLRFSTDTKTKVGTLTSELKGFKKMIKLKLSVDI